MEAKRIIKEKKNIMQKYINNFFKKCIIGLTKGLEGIIKILEKK